MQVGSLGERLRLNESGVHELCRMKLDAVPGPWLQVLRILSCELRRQMGLKDA